MRVSWDDMNKRQYEYGFDRGVLYSPGIAPVPWYGITGFDEGTDGSTTVLYRDGVVYMADADATDFGGKLTALTYPPEFAVHMGQPQATDGLFVDSQKPKRFGFCYRTLVGSGGRGDMFGYQIHLVYNAVASLNPRSRRTIGDDTAVVEFNFDIVCAPVKLQGFRPSAHYVIDTRFMSASTVSQLEDLLYGTSSTDGGLPDPQDLYDLMNFGDAMIFTVHSDGYFTVEGSNQNLEALDAYSFVMRNVNGTDNGDGTYVISDGGNTDVIIE